MKISTKNNQKIKSTVLSTVVCAAGMLSAITCYADAYYPPRSAHPAQSTRPSHSARTVQPVYASQSVRPVSCKEHLPFYLRLDLGASWYRDFKASGEYKKAGLSAGPLYNFGVGYKFHENARGDVNFQFRNIEYKKGKDRQNIDNYAIFVNGYFDVPVTVSSYEFVPYLTGGLGYSRVVAGGLVTPPAEGAWEGKFTNNIGVNLGLGVKAKVIDNLSVDLTYRYSWLGDVETHTVDDSSPVISKQQLRAGEITFGVIYDI